MEVRAKLISSAEMKQKAKEQKKWFNEMEYGKNKVKNARNSFQLKYIVRLGIDIKKKIMCLPRDKL